MQNKLHRFQRPGITRVPEPFGRKDLRGKIHAWKPRLYGEEGTVSSLAGCATSSACLKRPRTRQVSQLPSSGACAPRSEDSSMRMRAECEPPDSRSLNAVR